jgi:phosphoribosylformimino-5-aminoimidazole carboxamide ribotide isomerase
VVLGAEDAVQRCREAGVRRILCTAIERDGTLAGPNVELLARVCELSGLSVLAAGGVRSLDDLTAVESAGCEGAIVGRALLDEAMPLAVFASESRAGLH